MSGIAIFPHVTVSELITYLQAAQAEGYGALPVLLGAPDGPLSPVTVIEHIVSEGVLLRAVDAYALSPGYREQT